MSSEPLLCILPTNQIHALYIRSGKREEAFYEIIVQFGDCKTTPCGSERGEIARNLLDEYMREFSARNPRLYVFTVTAMERVLGGTYVQNLIGDERRRRESRFIPNGVIVR